MRTVQSVYERVVAERNVRRLSQVWATVGSVRERKERKVRKLDVSVQLTKFQFGKCFDSVRFNSIGAVTLVECYLLRLTILKYRHVLTKPVETFQSERLKVASTGTMLSNRFITHVSIRYDSCFWQHVNRLLKGC